MGAQLTGAVFAYLAREHEAGRPLAHNERLLLLFMAHTAMDADHPPRYFGSRERSSIGLGRIVPDEPGLEDPAYQEKAKCRRNAFELVKTATRGLVQRGVLERLKSGRAGQRAEYAIRLPDSLTPPRGTVVPPLSGGSADPLRGTVGTRPRGMLTPPSRNHYRNNEE